MTVLILSTQHCTGDSTQNSKARKINRDIEIGKEEINLFLDDTTLNTVVPPYSQGIHSKMHSRCVKLWLVPNSIYIVFFLYIDTYDEV